MKNNLFPHLWRGLIFVLIQGLILKQVALKVGSYFHILLYPLFILLLPFRLGTPVLVLIGFATGLTVDWFYETPGIHAATGVFAGWWRGLMFGAFQPRAGYSGKEPMAAPEYFGWRWFAPMAALFFLGCCFWYYSVDYFTFFYWTKIALKTFAAWSFTMIFVFLYMLAFNPKQ